MSGKRACVFGCFDDEGFLLHSRKKTLSWEQEAKLHRSVRKIGDLMGGDEYNQVEKSKKSYRDSLLGSNLENLRQVVLQEEVDSMEIEAPSDDGEDSLEETLATKVAHISLTQELVMGGNIVLKPKQQRRRRREKKDESLKLSLAVGTLSTQANASPEPKKVEEDGFGSWLLVQSKRQNREVSSPDQLHRKWEVAHSSNSKSVVLNYDKTKQSVVLPNAGKKVEKVQKEDTQNMGTVKDIFPSVHSTKTIEKGKRKESPNVLDNETVCQIGGGSHRLDVAWEGNPISTKADISIRKKLTLEPTLENGSEGGPKEVATGKFLQKSLRLGDKVETCKRDDDRMDGREQSNPGPTILHHEGNAVERDKEDSKLGTSKATAISVLSRAISSREKFKRKHQTKEVTSSGREALSADPHLVALFGHLLHGPSIHRNI
ncbi:hypothetical protein Gotur_009535 [Gossypium turneri]